MSVFQGVSESPPAIITPASPQAVGVQLLSTNTIMGNVLAWPSSNLAIFVPIKIGAVCLAVKMFWKNSTTNGTNTVDVGIYDSQGNRLVSSGTITTSGSNALQSVDITDTTLAPGLYYMAMVVNGTTDTFWASAPAAVNCRAIGILSQASASPLPNPATMVGTTTAYIPLFGIAFNTVT